MSETRFRADSPAAGPAAGTTGDPQAMSDRLNEFADSTLAHLDAQQAVLDRRLAALTGERFDKDLAMAGAALARARSAAVAELRKLEKHDRTQARTPDQRHRLVMCIGSA